MKVKTHAQLFRLSKRKSLSLSFYFTKKKKLCFIQNEMKNNWQVWRRKFFQNSPSLSVLVDEKVAHLAQKKIQHWKEKSLSIPQFINRSIGLPPKMNIIFSLCFFIIKNAITTCSVCVLVMKNYTHETSRRWQVFVIWRFVNWQSIANDRRYVE